VKMPAKKSDLNPPLGYPGGPCQVIQRIHSTVRNPKLRDELVDDVEGYKGLSNTDAAKVYKLEVEKGAKAKFLQRLRITPHAQYRMDQRGITVQDVRVALMHFAKEFYDSKSQQGSFYRNRSEELARGEKILWVDKKVGRLAIVFVAAGQGALTLVTAYWEGLGDPKPVDESVCKVAQRFALRQEPSPGVQTYVTDKSQLDLPNNKDNSDKEPPSAAPLPGSATPGGAGRDIGTFEYNTPGPNSDIKPRTLGTPGAERGHPTNFITPGTMSRRTMTGEEEGHTKEGYKRRWKPGVRQRKTKGRNKHKRKMYYRNNRHKIKARQKVWRQKNKNNPLHKYNRKHRRKNPNQHRRRYASAMSVAALYEVVAYETGTRGGPQPTRQRRQRPAVSRLDNREYKQRKALKSRQALKRYHTFCKRNRNCLRQRQLYRDNPKRYRRRPPGNSERTAQLLVTPEIGFSISKDMLLGYVHSISPMTGLVTFSIDSPGVNQLDSMPLDVFFRVVVFLEEADVDAFFELVDAEVGLEAYNEIDEDTVRYCARLYGKDPESAEFKAKCMLMTGEEELSSLSADVLENVNDKLVLDVLEGGTVRGEPEREDEDPKDDVYDLQLIYGEVPLDGQKQAGAIILYDQHNPSNNEIKQPGADVNYRADSPSTYEKKPDEREGVPPGAEMPSNQTENVPPASSRVIPDQMKDTLREQQTYMKSAARTACVVAVTEIEGTTAMMKVRDRNYVPRIKVIREMQSGTEMAHLFDTWTGWSEGVNEYGIGLVSSALLVEVDEGEKKVSDRNSKAGRKIRNILGATSMDEAIEVTMGNPVKGCTFLSDGEDTVLIEFDGREDKGGLEPVLKRLKKGEDTVRTNHGVFLSGSGYTSGEDLKSSKTRKRTTERALKDVTSIDDLAPAIARTRDTDRANPLNPVRATDNMSTSTQIVSIPSEKEIRIYLIPDEVDFVGIENRLPKGRKPRVKIELFEYEEWDSDDPKAVPVPGDPEVFRLFTYGSMMHKPSYSKDVIRSYKATLKGHHRAYNRTSQSRDGIYVLGTEPGGNIEGVVHEYPTEVGHRVLGQVDRREGFRTERPEDKNSYLRKAINVKTPEGIARATVYLSNPEGPNYHKPLTPEQAAKEIVGVPKAEKYLRSISKALEEYGSKSSYVKKVERQSEKRKAVKTALFPVELPDNNEPTSPVYDTEYDTCSELPNGQEKTAAANVEEILSNCGLQLKGRAQDVSYGRKRLSPSGLSTWVASGSRGEKYTIRIKPIRKDKRIKAVAKLPIQVSCSCPYFRWQGPEHWAKKHGYLYGRQVGTASTPNIKDPKGRHWACKHVIAVLQLARKWRYSSEHQWSYEGDIVPMPDPRRVAHRYSDG